jgi:plasmid stabilization system protein ParE
MTTYRVVVEPQALEEIADAYQWIASHSPAAAVRWFNGLTAARDSLRQYPARCPVVAGRNGSGSEIRQLLYGRRRNRYRMLFAVRGDTVHILRVIHGARSTGP